MTRTRNFFITIGLVATLAVGAAGCGYRRQTRGNTWAREGVRRVYIEAMKNKTLKAGVEIQFISALIKEFSRGARIRLVDDPKVADAVLATSIDVFESRMSSQTTVAATAPDDPKAQELGDFTIAAEYSVGATMSVRLARSSDGKVLWSQSFSRSKVYPSSNRFGLEGSTSALINGSQESLALGEIAQFLASDAHDAMFEAF